LIKINRRLKRDFKTEGDLHEEIKSKLSADKNGNVSVDQLRDFVLGIVEPDMINLKITKRDVEGFLSAFSYNAYGSTNVDKIASMVYTRDDQIPNKLAERKWANPPPEDVNKEFSTSEVKTEDMHNHKIKGILNEIEDKVFNGKVKMYQLFRKFDHDHDGYVSYADFESCIKSLKVNASQNDMNAIMNLVDKNNNGFLTFTEFSKVFSPSMSSNLVTVDHNDSTMQNSQPSQAQHKQHLKTLEGFAKKTDTIRETLKPDLDPKLNPATRYGSKPNFASTFVNF